MEWERRSGATFEGDKTAFVHFTRSPARSSDQPIVVKEKEVRPTASTKILGVVMDAELRFEQHIARAATKGLAAAMALKRLRALLPAIARRLFETIVTPVVDYAASVWMHACKGQKLAAINRVQRIGAQAIIGCFRTVSTAISESEASIRTVQQRYIAKATRVRFSLGALPRTNPLSRIRFRATRRFTSLL